MAHAPLEDPTGVLWDSLGPWAAVPGADLSVARRPTEVVQVSTTEVRWILPGAVPPEVARWFDRFSPRRESRGDLYLLRPTLDGLSVKVRGGSTLDVKFHTGFDEAPITPGPVAGRTSSCQKWSFIFGPPGELLSDGTGWKAVSKVRRINRFSPSGRLVPSPPPGPPAPAGCAVELTDIALADSKWWTLGFEATGPVEGRRPSIEAALATVFGDPLPAAVHLGTGNCMSYASWLLRL
jgi:hypothetical protein